MKSEDWDKALNGALDADAVPTKSLDEFVAACMADCPGRWSRFVEWLSAPRRAVAATVAGSMLLTCAVVSAIAFMPFRSAKTAPYGPPQTRFAAGIDSLIHGDWENEF